MVKQAHWHAVRWPGHAERDVVNQMNHSARDSRRAHQELPQTPQTSHPIAFAVIYGAL